MDYLKSGFRFWTRLSPRSFLKEAGLCIELETGRLYGPPSRRFNVATPGPEVETYGERKCTAQFAFGDF